MEETQIEASTSESPTITEQAISDTVSDAVEASAKAAKAKPAFEDIDAVIKALADQDEVLKTMKTQITDMISQNAALRKGIKQIVQDTSKNDALESELAAAKKKLATLKQFLGA